MFNLQLILIQETSNSTSRSTVSVCAIDRNLLTAFRRNTWSAVAPLNADQLRVEGVGGHLHVGQFNE